MRLTRKLYSEPDEDEKKKREETLKRRRNIGLIGLGAGAILHGIGRHTLNSKRDYSKHVREALEKARQGGTLSEAEERLANAGLNATRLKTGGVILGGAGSLLAAGSEIRRRKEKKKNDDNKA